MRKLDYHINQTYQLLKELNILNEALLIFTSDNGPWRIICDLAESQGPFTGDWKSTQRPFGGGCEYIAKHATEKFARGEFSIEYVTY